MEKMTLAEAAEAAGRFDNMIRGVQALAAFARELAPFDNTKRDMENAAIDAKARLDALSQDIAAANTELLAARAESRRVLDTAAASAADIAAQVERERQATEQAAQTSADAIVAAGNAEASNVKAAAAARAKESDEAMRKRRAALDVELNQLEAENRARAENNAKLAEESAAIEGRLAAAKAAARAVVEGES